MGESALHSIAFELVTRREACVPSTLGHLAHALFLNLIKRFDQALSARLHNEPTYRPYTISSLIGGKMVDGRIRLRRG